MSLVSEEFVISHEHASDKSSSLEDSLTAKLDNMLHSSDEIVVENANFFQPSSNEMTEMEEVGELPQSDSHSVPKLDLEEHNRGSNNYLEYKSSESYTSLGTVVRHETPKIGQRKIKVVKPPRPLSAKNRSVSSRPKENSNEKELIMCLKKIAKKHPEYSRLIRNEKNDFEKFFYVKVKEFRNMLEDNIGGAVTKTKEKLRLKNKEKEKKREEIRTKLREEELERIRTSNLKYQENCKNRLKYLVDATLKKYQTIKMVEDTKIAKEVEEKKKKQKQDIIANIRTFYDNKIQMFREKMIERKMFKTLFEYEHKLVYSEAEKCRRHERKLVHEKNIELLKQQVVDIELESKAEEESIHRQIIKLYKNSSKSRKRHQA